MANKKTDFKLIVNCPSTEDDIKDLRIRMGNAYYNFIKEYILKLNIEDNEKNELHRNIAGILK